MAIELKSLYEIMGTLKEENAALREKVADTQTALDMAISDYGDAIERQRKAEARYKRLREAVEQFLKPYHEQSFPDLRKVLEEG